jgi:hypothetical protein
VWLSMKRRFLQEPRGVISQETEFLFVGCFDLLRITAMVLVKYFRSRSDVVQMCASTGVN